MRKSRFTKELKFIFVGIAMFATSACIPGKYNLKVNTPPIANIRFTEQPTRSHYLEKICKPLVIEFLNDQDNLLEVKSRQGYRLQITLAEGSGALNGTTSKVVIGQSLSFDDLMFSETGTKKLKASLFQKDELIMDLVTESFEVSTNPSALCHAASWSWDTPRINLSAVEVESKKITLTWQMGTKTPYPILRWQTE